MIKPSSIATLPGVVPDLPEPLRPLAEIAYNLFWTFHSGGAEVLARLDPRLWEQSGHNPVRLLTTVAPERLHAMSRDADYVARIGRVHDALRAHLRSRAWFDDYAATVNAPGAHFLAAYFCAEFGLTECFQIYSGGLGLLAGDHLKSAAELGLPLIGLGLLYRNGYFHQKLDSTGLQDELFPPLDPVRQPVNRVMDLETGRQITVGVQMPGREVRCALWRVDVGRVRLYLLDTNLPENAAEDRDITANLYLGDQNRRIQQELVLGVGGVRALAAAGEHPTVFHMNEGHAAFLALERIRDIRVRAGLSFDQAREAAAAAHVFTTHTPVPAGIDHFNIALIQHYFAGYHEQLGLDMEGLMALGREDVSNKNEAFSMAILALRCSRFCNGVSRLHGSVSRRMWKGIWPHTPESDIPIGHVTNGVNAGSWIGPAMGGLYDKHLAAGWRSRPQDAEVWAGIEKIADADLWAARNASRAALVDYCRSMAERGRTGGVPCALDPSALTIGFARRFAGYKRGTLLLRDLARLKALLGSGRRGIQLVVAGKSHPGDGWGKQLIREIVEFARSESAHGRVLFLEDYAIDVARQLVQGCDVWLNTPIRGLEASGTSGMKAALNGVLHASILDGWWDEAYTPEAGYKIPDSGIYPSDAPNEEREKAESEALYALLEREIVPEFYTRDDGGVPRQWTARMKACIRALAPVFNTNRMVAEYAQNYYFPAHAAATRLAAADFRGARELSDHIDRYRKLWAQVRIKSVDCAPAAGGHAFAAGAAVRLGMLRPDEVRVQVYHGALGDKGAIHDGHAVDMLCKAPMTGGDGTYQYAAKFDMGPHAPGERYGLIVRVVPGDDRLVTPFVPGLITNSLVTVAEAEPGTGL